MSSSRNGNKVAQPNAVPSQKGVRFWLIFTSMCICLSLSALELSSVSTALPTIANDLDASQFTWVGSAYALSSTAFLPMSGDLAETFGRRPAVLLSIGLFALGSAICGAAYNMNMLIAGRAVQGFGGGGIQTLTGIILGDLVCLKERGLYTGLYGLIWCLAASVGPVVGGSLAAQGKWRWLFNFNLPIALVACLSVIFLLDLPIPPGSYQDKFMRMDWIGNFLVIASTAAYTIGLTWGGITAPWSSAMVLIPLVLGLLGLVVFVTYEAIFATRPLAPISLMTNITSISGYMQTFCWAIITIGPIYYFPVYLQACKGLSPIVSGTYSVAGASTFAPAAIITGLSVQPTGRYRPQTWIGWTLTTVALALISTITETDSLQKSVVYLALFGLGTGVLSPLPMYPIQAPLPVTQSAPALAFMWLLHSFATVWGITIGGSVLQNMLGKMLPASFIQSIPQGTEITYALIPELSMLPPQTLSEVQAAFAGSLAVLWRVLTAISCAGFVASFFMKGLPLHNTVDAEWALKNDKAHSSIVTMSEHASHTQSEMTKGLAGII